MKFLAVFAIFTLAAAQNWCTIPQCQPGTHIACLYPNYVFGPSCVSPVLREMTHAIQDVIVNRHNYFRNMVAGGSVMGYQGVVLPMAVRMAKMQWDQTLSQIAAINALQCRFEHDQCRNTPTFNWSGQNLAMLWTSFDENSPNFHLEEFLMDMIEMWYNEHVFTRVSDIDQLTTIYNGNEAIGHFTALANELQTHVGCAVIHFNDGSWRSHYLVCNYAFTNLLNFPVYRSGAPASECTTGRDYVFSNLCTVNEAVNPNPFELSEFERTYIEELLADNI